MLFQDWSCAICLGQLPIPLIFPELSDVIIQTVFQIRKRDASVQNIAIKGYIKSNKS